MYRMYNCTHPATSMSQKPPGWSPCHPPGAGSFPPDHLPGPRQVGMRSASPNGADPGCTRVLIGLDHTLKMLGNPKWMVYMGKNMEKPKNHL